MASVKKFGEAVVITSALKLEDIKKAVKYRPDALVLYGGEDGKEPVFAIGTSTNRCGSINSVSVDFGGADAEGFAQVTLTYAGPDEGVREALADSIGRQLVQLAKLEETLPAVLAEIDAEIAAVMETIEIG